MIAQIRPQSQPSACYFGEESSHSLNDILNNKKSANSQLTCSWSGIGSSVFGVVADRSLVVLGSIEKSMGIASWHDTGMAVERRN